MCVEQLETCNEEDQFCIDIDHSPADMVNSKHLDMLALDLDLPPHDKCYAHHKICHAVCNIHNVGHTILKIGHSVCRLIIDDALVDRNLQEKLLAGNTSEGQSS